MTYFIPQDPAGTKFLKIPQTEKVNLLADFYLADLVKLDSHISYGKKIVGMGSNCGHEVEKKAYALEGTKKLSYEINPQTSIIIFIFSDNSAALGMQTHTSNIVQFVPVVLHAAQKEELEADAKLWLNAMNDYPKLHLNDVIPPYKNGLIPTWNPHKLMTDEEVRKLRSFATIALNAFCAKHDLPSDARYGSLNIISRGVHRDGSLTHPTATLDLRNRSRQMLTQSVITDFENEVSAILLSPKSPVPSDALVHVVKEMSQKHWGLTLRPALIATGFPGPKCETAHERIAAIAPWQAYAREPAHDR